MSVHVILLDIYLKVNEQTDPLTLHQERDHSEGRKVSSTCEKLGHPLYVRLQQFQEQRCSVLQVCRLHCVSVCVWKGVGCGTCVRVCDALMFPKANLEPP